MKSLSAPALARLNAFLDNVDVGDYQVHGDVEVYSCKLAGLDKKLCKSLEDEVTAGSSPLELSRSPVGPLSEPSSRKTLIYLILTLNCTYPDYDFSQLRAQNFEKEPSVANVCEQVDSHLLEVSKVWESSPSGGQGSFADTLWQAVDEAIDMRDCDVYSYKSDGELDPLSERGNVWSFNFFFHNKRLKRMLYLACRGLSKTAADSLQTSAAGTVSSGFQAPESEEESEAEGRLKRSEAAAARYGMADTMDL